MSSITLRHSAEGHSVPPMAVQLGLMHRHVNSEYLNTVTYSRRNSSFSPAVSKPPDAGMTGHGRCASRRAGCELGSISVSNKAGIKPQIVECFYAEAGPEALVAVSVVFAVLVACVPAQGPPRDRPGLPSQPSLAPPTALPACRRASQPSGSTTVCGHDGTSSNTLHTHTSDRSASELQH